VTTRKVAQACAAAVAAYLVNDEKATNVKFRQRRYCRAAAGTARSARPVRAVAAAAE
jgi:hypothetical protein